MQEESPRERLMTGKSWEDFCDTLKGAGQTILSEGSPERSLDRAEGFRYLSQIGKPPGSAGGLPKFDFSGNRYGKLPSVSRQSITRGSSIEPSQEFTSRSVGMSVSCCFHPEVPEENDLRPDP